MERWEERETEKEKEEIWKQVYNHCYIQMSVEIVGRRDRERGC